jgi:hypothetical protein
MNMDNYHYDCVIAGTGSAACLLVGRRQRDEPLIGSAGTIGRRTPIAERES